MEMVFDCHSYSGIKKVKSWLQLNLPIMPLSGGISY
jgi:hypothetical protein